ncbi:MAG: hypothetical protein ABR887_04480 [Methanoregulaceae archaeon]|jgi:hypothetical protein
MKKFEIGFWHPFGVHAKESRDEILSRKLQELKSNGWTFWSFQYRKTLEKWYENKKNKPLVDIPGF